MVLLSTVDLRVRWNYSRAGVHKLIKRSDFPEPFATVSQGKVKLFTEEVIQAYEQNKPWLFDELQKARRQKLYGLLHQANQYPDQQTTILQYAFGDNAKQWKRQ